MGSCSDDAPENQDARAQQVEHLHSTVLAEKALSKFNAALTKHVNETAAEKLKWALNDIAKMTFDQPEESHEIQHRHLQKVGLKMSGNEPSEFAR